jgi:hypothetical protein
VIHIKEGILPIETLLLKIRRHERKIILIFEPYTNFSSEGKVQIKST